jgi:hypothetical protein
MAYFGMNKGRIVFASPKVNPSTYEPLREAVEGVNTLMSELKLKFSFRLYANSDFEKDIIAPVIQLSGEVADTSELFMRSVQLYQIFTDRIKDAQQEGKERNRGTDEIKIGQLVRTTFKELFSKRKIGKKMAAKLMDVTYSKKTFGLSFPILKEINDSILLSKQITDGKGRSRYWSQEFANGKYLICSQWYAKHRKKFLDWSNKLLQE